MASEVLNSIQSWLGWNAYAESNTGKNTTSGESVDVIAAEIATSIQNNDETESLASAYETETT